MQVWVNGVKVCKDGLYVCVVRIKDEKYIVDVMEIVYDCVFFCKVTGTRLTNT